MKDAMDSLDSRTRKELPTLVLSEARRREILRQRIMPKGSLKPGMYFARRGNGDVEILELTQFATGYFRAALKPLGSVGDGALPEPIVETRRVHSPADLGAMDDLVAGIARFLLGHQEDLDQELATDLLWNLQTGLRQHRAGRIAWAKFALRQMWGLAWSALVPARLINDPDIRRYVRNFLSTATSLAVSTLLLAALSQQLNPTIVVGTLVGSTIFGALSVAWRVVQDRFMGPSTMFGP